MEPLTSQKTMRVLWFTHIPVQTASRTYMGGNWITSLQQALLEHGHIELGICYYSAEQQAPKTISGNVTTYTIYRRPGRLKRLLQKHRHVLPASKLRNYTDIVEDFRPDIIQVFGTESSFGLVGSETRVPTVIHMQGVLQSCLDNWFPRGFTLRDTFRFASPKSILLGNGNYHRYFTLKKQAERESRIVRKNRFFFARTHFDKAFIKKLNPDAHIVHCDELLRGSFRERQWHYCETQGRTLQFVSVMNGEIYKGLDNALHIAASLIAKGAIDFRWVIVGVEEDHPVIPLFEGKTGMLFSENKIRFAGKKEEKELAALLAESDLFLHVSHIDNSPNSLCEAMLTGMPVVCNDVGGCASLIRNGEDGILLPDYAHVLWAETLAGLAADPATLKKLGSAARITAMQRHDSGAISAHVLHSYGRIIATPFNDTP